MSEYCFLNLSEKIPLQEKLTGGDYVYDNFIFKGKPLTGNEFPVWGMSLLKGNSMRFRWNETNPNRTAFLQKICSLGKKQLKPVSLELIHSKDVYYLQNGDETRNCRGDGMITKNESLVPVVTVADCMPIFLYDVKNGLFATLHSGWKGTGIVQKAFETAEQKFSSRAEDICVVLGPHIGECCYIVDEERAEYFATNFTPDCVHIVSENELSECAVPDWNTQGKTLYRLSLTQANLSVLRKLGIPEANTIVCTDCTCCKTFGDEKKAVYGSFRRQTASLPKNLEIEKRWLYFTVQAAFCGFLF